MVADRRLWRISYLPTMDIGVCEWLFKGTGRELHEYLMENHSCSCEDCMSCDNWWDTAQSAEYIIEDEGDA